MRVLIVEDSEIMRQEIRRLVSMLPETTVVFETNTQQAADAWLSAYPDDWDLALVDLFLATGNGFGVLKSCTSRAAHQKVVVMTNYVNEMVRARVANAGADAFFDKTRELDQLGAYCRDLAQGMSVGRRSTLRA